MINIKRLTALTMATVLATTTFLTGCSKKTTVEETVISNKSDFAEAYKNTVFVVVPEKEQATVEATSVEMTKTPATENSTEDVAAEIDVKDCGDFNTVAGQYVIPEIKVSEDITYISPVVSNSEIKSVKFVEDIKEEAELGSAEDATAEETVEEVSEEPSTESTEDYVKETTVTVDGKEVNAFNLTHAGIYEMEIGTDTVTVTVKNGSIFDDMLAGNAVKNIIVNTESKEFMELANEYEDTLPALIAQYLSQYDSEEEAIKALESENADLLKEFNRIRKLKGEEALSATDIVATYKPEDVEAANEKAESATSMRGIGAKVYAMRSNTYSTESGSEGGSTDTSNLAYQAFVLINNYRVQNGVPELTWSNSDAAVASVRANELVSNFSHSSASGTKTHGENIAKTSTSSAQNVVDLWIASPGHRANILRTSFTTAGLAVVYSNGTYYWSNNFSYPVVESGENAGQVDTDKMFSGDNVTTTTETTSDGKQMTVQTDDSGNKNIIVGPQADADGWIDAHVVAEKSSVTIQYDDGNEAHSLSPVSFEEINWDRINEYTDNVWVSVHIKANSDSGLVGTYADANMVIYRDGHIEDAYGANEFLANINAPCKINKGTSSNSIGISVKH